MLWTAFGKLTKETESYKMRQCNYTQCCDYGATVLTDITVISSKFKLMFDSDYIYIFSPEIGMCFM